MVPVPSNDVCTASDSRSSIFCPVVARLGLAAQTVEVPVSSSVYELDGRVDSDAARRRWIDGTVEEHERAILASSQARSLAETPRLLARHLCHFAMPFAVANIAIGISPALLPVL